MREQALRYLRTALGNPTAEFHEDQWESIEAILAHKRVLVVQRTGWGELVAKGKYQDDCFSDEMVAACVEMLAEWNPEPAPAWITCIPSTRHPTLVMDFAQRLATILNITFINCITKTKENRQQKEMENSFQQARNLDGVFTVNLEHKDYSPCLLVDDMVDSCWTFTVASALLRQVGCSAVYPMALAVTSSKKD